MSKSSFMPVRRALLRALAAVPLAAAPLAAALASSGAFAAEATAAAVEPKRILVFGDSNAYGWTWTADGRGSRLPVSQTWPEVMARALGARYRVVVNAVGGRTVDEDIPGAGGGALPPAAMNGMAALPGLLSAHAPLDLVVVMLGSNDLRDEHHRSAEDIALSLGKMAAYIQEGRWQSRMAFPAPRALLIAPPKIDGRLTGKSDNFKGALEKSERLPALLKGAADVAGAAFMDGSAVVPFAEQLDHIHLTPVQHEALGRAAAKKVREVLGGR